MFSVFNKMMEKKIMEMKLIIVIEENHPIAKIFVREPISVVGRCFSNT